MIQSKFNIGQQVKHKLLGFPGVVIDVDAEYSLKSPKLEELEMHQLFTQAPWYHVVLQDEYGKQIHTYLAEQQIDERLVSDDEAELRLNEIADSVREQYIALKERN